MQSQSQRIIQKILNSQLRDESSIQQNVQNPHINQQDIVQMVIQLDSNRSATIKIHIDDDPLILAKAFCFQYSIDPRVINTLANNIKNVKNMEFHQLQNHNKSRISQVFDKENNSTTINVSQSINESFNKGNRSTKSMRNKSHEKSFFTNKNDATQLSNYDCMRQSVFDRLYKDSRKKKVVKNCINQTNQKEMKKLHNSNLKQSNLSDPCLLIYNKNTKAHQAALMRRSELHQLKQSKVTQGCTFKPQINPISQLIANKLPHSYLSQQNRERDMRRIQQYIKEKQRKQSAQCTFEPRILSKSRQRSKSTDRYRVLYEDSKKRQLNRRQSEEKLQMSRKKTGVKINKISESIVGDKSFFQRLQQDQQKRQQKKMKIQAKIKQQQNRRPSTGRAPQNRPRNISIGQHLYNQAKNKSKQRQLQSLNSTSKNKLTCFKSDQIYQNTKKTAFQYIFALLDGNEDGLISNTKINISRLSHDILILLTPLLIELEQMQAQLDESQFVEALNRLFNNLSIPDRQKILNAFRFKNNKQFEQQHSFKPALNQNSLLWANQKRPQNTNLYDLWKQTQEQKQQRLEQIRTLKILEELSQCTFHPKLFR